MSGRAYSFRFKGNCYHAARCAVLACLLFQTSSLFASTLTLDRDSIQLGRFVEYLEDADGSLTIEQARLGALSWVKSQRDVLSFGYSASAYWVRVDLSQTGEQSASYLLEIAYPVLDHVDVYVIENDLQIAHYTMGDQQPYFQRPADHPNFLAPVVVHPDVITTVYLRILSSSAVQIPLMLYSDLKLVETNYNRGMIQALFYGAMLVMALYNLLIFLSIRDINYLYYVLVVLSVLTMLAGIEGLTFKYLWPNTFWLNDAALIVALSGTVVFSALLFRRFLDTPNTRPALDKIILLTAILPLFTMVGAFVFPYRPMVQITILLSVFGIAVGFWAAIVRWRDGLEAAKYLNLAWSFLLGAGFVFALNKFGFLPRNGFTENVVQIGAGMQALLLSFALAYRMNHERDLRERAEEESAAAQQALLDQQIRTNEELDRLVRLRAAELKKANERLKELGATDSLTGIHNRRAFEERFLVEFERAYRNQSPLAVLMIDLDHFKRINDRYGHLYGDLCLVRAAQAIKGSLCRPSDVVARYGGEEFIVMLPDTNLDGAALVGQTILGALARTVIDDGNYKVNLTASMGIAVCIPQDESDREELLKEADRNLYLAKENGRNRVEWQQWKPLR